MALAKGEMVLKDPSCCRLPFGFEVGLALCGGWTRCPLGIPSELNHSMFLCFPLRRCLGSSISQGCISWSGLFIGGCPKINECRDQKLFWKSAGNFYIWVKLTVITIVSDCSMILFALAMDLLSFMQPFMHGKGLPIISLTTSLFFKVFMEVSCKEPFPPEPPNTVIGNWVKENNKFVGVFLPSIRLCSVSFLPSVRLFFKTVSLMEKNLVLSGPAIRLGIMHSFTSLTPSTPAQVSQMPKIHTFLQRSLCSYYIPYSNN